MAKEKLRPTVERSLAQEPVEHVGRTPITLPTGLRAYELLSAQPMTLAGLTQQERNAVVVTAILDDAGREHVICRIGDSSWDLDCGWTTQNAKRSERIGVWPKDIPPSLLDDAKAVMYAWYKRGRSHGRTPSMRSISSAIRAAAPTLRDFAASGFVRFDQIQPIHLSDYTQELKRRLKPKSVHKRLQIFDLVWVFRQEAFFPLRNQPWGGRVPTSGQSELSKV